MFFLRSAVALAKATRWLKTLTLLRLKGFGEQSRTTTIAPARRKFQVESYKVYKVRLYKPDELFTFELRERAAIVV